MFKLFGISLILAVVIQLSAASPLYQFLPPRDGYVPVYIRLGDTPLDEINPDLALAFHENGIATRNAVDIEEQMQNDAPNVQDLSESDEETNEKITITKGSVSEEEGDEKPASDEKKDDPPNVPDNKSDEEDEKPVSNERRDESQNDSPAPDNKSDEVSSDEETDLTHLTKDDNSEETGESSPTTKKSSPDDSDDDSLEATKSRRNVTVPPPPPPPAKEDGSSEEVDDTVSEKKPTTSYESKSSEEVADKS